MDPIKFDVTLTDEKFFARAGLPLAGCLLAKTDLRKQFNQLAIKTPGTPLISHGDIALSMIGLQCLARPDYAAIEDEEPMELLRLGLGIKRLPSQESLRQRLDQIGQLALEQALQATRQASVDMLTATKATVTACASHQSGRRWVAMDVDVSPFDNSDTRKENVSRTYKQCDGYAPIFAYLGQEGYLVHSELRPGSQHSQKGAVDFLKESLDLAQQVLATCDPKARVLLRMDAAHDDVENLELGRKRKGVDFLIKRNLRQENPQEWLEIAEAHGQKEQPRKGKTIWCGDYWLERGGRTYRVVFEVIERKIDKHGQELLIPDIEISTWWTSLPRTKINAIEVIDLYHQHGTSEQFHSELKSDMDLERMASGKFKTNCLLLGLGQVAYNVLRLMGQQILEVDDQLPPEDQPPLKRRKGKGNSKAKPHIRRRRLRRVIQDLMYQAVQLVRTGRRWCLRLSSCNPWAAICRAMYLRLTPT